MISIILKFSKFVLSLFDGFLSPTQQQAIILPLGNLYSISSEQRKSTLNNSDFIFYYVLYLKLPTKIGSKVSIIILLASVLNSAVSNSFKDF